MKKTKKRQKNVPGGLQQSLGTQVLGQVVVPYVQFDIPSTMASEVASAVGQVMLDEYYLARIRALNVGNSEEE